MAWLSTIGCLMAGLCAAQWAGTIAPPLDPRHTATRVTTTAAHVTIEDTRDAAGRLDRCAMRVETVKNTRDIFGEIVWRMGVTRDDPEDLEGSMFIEIRLVDRATGAAIPMEAPTLYLQWTGPTYRWTVRPLRDDGFVRWDRRILEASYSEVLSFGAALEDRWSREVAMTLPNNLGDRYLTLHDGADAEQLRRLRQCVCAMSLAETAPMIGCL